MSLITIMVEPGTNAESEMSAFTNVKDVARKLRKYMGE